VLTDLIYSNSTAGVVLVVTSDRALTESNLKFEVEVPSRGRWSVTA